jgi:hypothetical protein
MVEQLNANGTATARYTQGLGIDEPRGPRWNAPRASVANAPLGAARPSLRGGRGKAVRSTDCSQRAGESASMCGLQYA